MNPEIKKNIGLAKAYQESDPASALVKIRIATELLVREIYEKNKLEKSYSNLYEAISNENFTKLMPPNILSKFHTIRGQGNKGAHADGVKPEYVTECGGSLLDIIDWYDPSFDYELDNIEAAFRKVMVEENAELVKAVVKAVTSTVVHETANKTRLLVRTDLDNALKAAASLEIPNLSSLDMEIEKLAKKIREINGPIAVAMPDLSPLRGEIELLANKIRETAESFEIENLRIPDTSSLDMEIEKLEKKIREINGPMAVAMQGVTEVAELCEESVPVTVPVSEDEFEESVKKFLEQLNDYHIGVENAIRKVNAQIENAETLIASAISILVTTILFLTVPSIGVTALILIPIMITIITLIVLVFTIERFNTNYRQMMGLKVLQQIYKNVEMLRNNQDMNVKIRELYSEVCFLHSKNWSDVSKSS